MTTHIAEGYEVVCPDGLVRSYPHHNAEDAWAAARDMTEGRKGAGHDGRPGCSPWPASSELELKHPPCKGGVHGVRKTVAAYTSTTYKGGCR